MRLCINRRARDILPMAAEKLFRMRRVYEEYTEGRNTEKSQSV